MCNKTIVIILKKKMKTPKEKVIDVPRLMEERDTEANAAEGIFPDKLGSQSNIYACWVYKHDTSLSTASKILSFSSFICFSFPFPKNIMYKIYISILLSSSVSSTYRLYAGIPYPIITLLCRKYVLLQHLSPEFPSMV